MYTVVYNRKETCNNQSVTEVHEYPHQFRLKRNAVHWIREIVQSDFRTEGYSTEPISKGGISCYKSEKTPEGNRKYIEFTVEVKKV